VIKRIRGKTATNGGLKRYPAVEGKETDYVFKAGYPSSKRKRAITTISTAKGGGRVRSEKSKFHQESRRYFKDVDVGGWALDGLCGGAKEKYRGESQREDQEWRGNNVRKIKLMVAK